MFLYHLQEQLLDDLNIYQKEDNFYLKFTGTKDIDTNKNLGYQYGILYEDNCLGIDLNYYRDLTIDRDIKESDGYSLSLIHI